MSVDLSVVTDDELLEKTGLFVSALTTAFGAEVQGADLSRKLDKPAFELIHRAWLKYGFLIFRNQNLDPDTLLAFSSRFGDLENAPIMANGRTFVEGYPEVFVISNVVSKDGQIGSLGNGELDWHSDMSYFDMPPKASCLYAVEVPEGEGKTGFLSMYEVYEKLPAALRRQIANLSIKHDRVYTLDGYLREGGGRSLRYVKAQGTFDAYKLPGAWHPMVRAHPETERLTLFVGRRQNACVEGMNLAESKAFMDGLWKHISRVGKRAYHHDWRTGDLAIWDNRCVMLRRDGFPRSSRRVMYRTQIKSCKPGLES